MNMDVLIIEDNESISTALSKFLKIYKFDCTVANDGKNGLAQLKTKKWDAVLLDLALPDFSGIDVVDELEKLGEIKNNNVIVLTATVLSNGDKKNLLSKGVKEILYKPVDPDLIIATLKKFGNND